MKELTLREIQLSSLEILKTFADICEKNGFKYVLAYGTLLGAVRHKGFIPWDDDLDVIMPRPDYNKFIEYCKNHTDELKPLELMHYSTNKRYIYPITRLSNSTYIADYNIAQDYGLGTFIDIYPFDGCGNNEEDIQKIYDKSKKLIVLISLAGQKKYEKSHHGKIVRSIGKLIVYCFAHLIGVNKLCKAIDNKSQRISCETSNYLGCTVWDNCCKNSVLKSIFDDIIYIDFEDKQFAVPREYDAVLTKWYGDYMKLPPESERVGHHYYKIYKRD